MEATNPTTNPLHPAFFDGCPWSVEVANGNPEPDFPEDCYDIVECGAKVRLLDDDPTGEGGWQCDNGHHHFTYGGPRWAVEDHAEWEAERRAASQGW